MNNIYKEIELDTEIMQASPHRLVQMMFEKCMDGIIISRQLMRENDTPKKCHMLTKVINIICHLRDTLDMENEECRELSTHLKNVYDYIEHQLIMANLKNEPIYLDNAMKHLQRISAAWDKIEEES